jgi:murein DD-endopeptidase MepM/ murein hydrolase activator NlpD
MDLSLVAGIHSDFLVCPPLDYPLRLAFDVGFFGAPRVGGQSGGDCCSDHFASVTPDGSAGLHQIHEAVDLASGAGSCVYAAYSGTIVGKEQAQLVIDHQGRGEAYASRYFHITPGPKAIGDRVVKGESIASVNPQGPGVVPFWCEMPGLG